MQISPKKTNFEKPSRNLSNRTKVKILEEKFFLDISQKKFGSAYAQLPRKCLNIEILAKIEGKEAKFFSKIYEGHIRIWFRSKKFKIISCLCTFKEWSVETSSSEICRCPSCESLLKLPASCTLGSNWQFGTLLRQGHLGGMRILLALGNCIHNRQLMDKLALGNLITVPDRMVDGRILLKISAPLSLTKKETTSARSMSMDTGQYL